MQIQFSISEITCVVCCSEPGNPRIAVYTPKLRRSKVIRLQFASDTEMEDWLAHLTLGKDIVIKQVIINEEIYAKISFLLFQYLAK